MINPNLYVNKLFKEQLEKFMNNTFGALKQTLIKNTMSKKNTSVLALLMFHETRGINPGKYFRVLNCVIYTIIYNYVCIYYLAYQLKDQVKFLWILNMWRNILSGYWVLGFQIY